MLNPMYTKPFKKQFKLLERRGMEMNKLREVMEKIVNEEPLPPERRNHPLQGKWKGAFDCHIQGDWVLVYETDRKAGTVTFHCTGSRADLF